MLLTRISILTESGSQVFRRYPIAYQLLVNKNYSTTRTLWEVKGILGSGGSSRSSSSSRRPVASFILCFRTRLDKNTVICPGHVQEREKCTDWLWVLPMIPSVVVVDRSLCDNFFLAQ